jgi:acetyl esterase/lipase
MTVTVRDEEIAGPHGPIAVRRYDDHHRQTSSPTVVWLHGGGFFRGNLDQPESDSVARSLAAAGNPVITVDYRLGPLPFLGWLSPRRKHRYPVPVDEVIAVLEHVTADGQHPIVLGGASAGACIAAGSALRFRHEGGLVAGVLLAYGFFHSTMPKTTSRHHRPRGHRRLTHSRLALQMMNVNYAPTPSARAERFAFPGGSDLSDFPPTLLVNAERDGMRASAELFANELESAGLRPKRHLVAGSKHAFLNRPLSTDFALGVHVMAQWLDGVTRR